MTTLVTPRVAEPGHPVTAVQKLRRSFTVNARHGLHARSCALLVKTLQRFQSNVQVEVGSELASGKSILGLMALGAAFGAEVVVTIAGDDAYAAMEAVRHLFDTNFEIIERSR